MGTGEKTDAGAPGVLNVLYNFYTSSEERTNETGCTVSVTKIELTGMKNVLLKGQIEKDIQAMNDDLAARRPDARPRGAHGRDRRRLDAGPPIPSATASTSSAICCACRARAGTR
jgi:hypothetical protein